MSFANKLRHEQIEKSVIECSAQSEFVLVLDDIYDTFNVGGMYRVADAAGVTKIYHCGKTPVPPDPKIVRASVGLVNYIPHEKVENISLLITSLKKGGYKIIILEQTKSSVIYDKIEYKNKLKLKDNVQTKIALVAGNETFGVKNEVIKSADLVVELPMYGINKSLNVVVSTGIMLYEIKRKLT